MTMPERRLKGRTYQGQHGLKDYLRTKEPQRDADGRAVIHMTIRDDTDFLSVFSERSTPVISTEVADYLEAASKAALPAEPLTLRIHSDCVDDHEEPVYHAAIREYYGGALQAVQRELRRSTMLALVMFLIGLALLLGAYWFGSSFSDGLWFEVFDIIATVFIWEATNVIAFQTGSLRVDKRRYLSFLSMKIEFYPLS